MRARNIDRNVATTTPSIPNGSYLNRDDDFSFTGFGSNDKRRKVLPTAGTYTITRGQRFTEGTYRTASRQIYPNGTITPWTINQWTGALYSQPSGQNLQSQWINDSNLVLICQNNALTRLYDRIRGSGLNALVSAGEYRESQRMILQTSKAVGSLITSARRLRRLLLTNPSLVLSSGWLAYTYGWRPLMNDIYEATHFHYRLFNEMSTRGRNKEAYDVSSNTDFDWWRMATYKTIEERVEYGLTVGITDSTTYNLARITSLNPLAVAWELMPLSFVVDWFWDLGTYLSNMEASLGMGLTFKRGYSTRTQKLTVSKLSAGARSRTYWYGSYYQIQEDHSMLAQGQREQVYKARSVLTGFPRPNFPAFQVNVGARRLMSAASLIRTILIPRRI